MRKRRCVNTFFFVSKALILILINTQFIFANDTTELKKYRILFDKENSVELHFLGKKYMPANINENNDLDKEQIFIKNVIDINQNGTIDEIVKKLWIKKDHKITKGVYLEAGYYEQNQSYFRNIDSTKLLFLIRYDSGFVFYVEHSITGHGSIRTPYLATKFNNQYYLIQPNPDSLFFKLLMFPLAEIIDKAKEL